MNRVKYLFPIAELALFSFLAKQLTSTIAVAFWGLAGISLISVILLPLERPGSWCFHFLLQTIVCFFTLIGVFFMSHSSISVPGAGVLFLFWGIGLVLTGFVALLATTWLTRPDTISRYWSTSSSSISFGTARVLFWINFSIVGATCVLITPALIFGIREIPEWREAQNEMAKVDNEIQQEFEQYKQRLRKLDPEKAQETIKNPRLNEKFIKTQGLFVSASIKLTGLIKAGNVRAPIGDSAEPIREFIDATKDAWNNNFLYRFPGKSNPWGFDLISKGPNGIGDGSDFDDILYQPIETAFEKEFRSGDVTLMMKKIKSPDLSERLEVVNAVDRSAVVNPAWVDPLILLLDDSSSQVRAEAAQQLGRFGNGAIPSLANHLGGTEGWAAAEALATIGEPAVEAIRAKLQENGRLAKLYGCVALMKIGPMASAAVPDLERLLNDPEYGVREAAGKALAKVQKQAQPS